ERYSVQHARTARLGHKSVMNARLPTFELIVQPDRPLRCQVKVQSWTRSIHNGIVMRVGLSWPRQVRMRKCQPPVAHEKSRIRDDPAPPVLQPQAATKGLFAYRPARQELCAQLNRRRYNPVKIMGVVAAKGYSIIDVVLLICISTRNQCEK